MKAIFSFILLVVFTSNLYAHKKDNEKHQLKGIVVSVENKGVPDVVLQLLSVKDSSLVKTEFSDEKGEFTFTEIPSGDYFIQTSVLGYEQQTTTSFNVTADMQMDPVALQKANVNLKEVNVTARKQYIERDHGKLIVNVENSIASTGSSAFEVIQKSPGVSIDNNDNIRLKGKGGLIVQIDGKITPMTGSDLGNYLRGIPSSSIEKIEFISNPSSKYDAAGSAIVNIKLKKDKRIGTNGSISVAYGQGIYPKSNNGATINYRNKKVNLFANYSYAYREAFNSLKLKRQFYQDKKYVGAYNQDNYLLFAFKNHIARAGMDYYINNKNTIGFVVNGVDNRFNPHGDNLSYVLDETATVVSRFETSNRSKDKWHNYSANFNLKHVFDTTGTELTADIDYAQFGNKTQQLFTTKYYDLNNDQYINPYVLYGNIRGNLNIYSVKTDFVKPLSKNAKFESGVKSSYVIADNNLGFYNRSSGEDIYDSAKSNHFIYTENINAGYAIVSKDWTKLSTQFGLRAEHTHVTGNQLVSHASFDTSYIQLFPSAFVGYKFNDKHGAEFNYSRRITRPGYDQLNPFKFYLDPTTYKEGNPYLKPQTTHSIEMSHVFKQKIYTTFGMGRTINNITEVLAPSETQAKLTIQTNKNLAKVDVYSLSVSIPVEVFKWWYTSTDVSVYYAGYTGTIAGTTISNKGSVTYNVNTVNTFNITSTFSAELSGNYRANEIYAYEKIKPTGFVTAGVQKKFMDNKAVIKINFSDMFYTSISRATTTFDNYVETYRVARDTRVLTTSFIYKFGKNSASPSRRRTGGAEDIKQRAGGGAG